MSKSVSYILDLFGRIAPRYDQMNDLITLGLHRRWKQRAVKTLRPVSTDGCILDLACGTGDLSFYLERAYPQATVFGLDFCPQMLAIARGRARHQNSRVQFVQGDALALPFPDDHFQAVISGYGLRNMTDYQRCLQEIWRVTDKVQGQLVILDLSHPAGVLARLSGLYRFRLVPLLGKLWAGDREAYTYLPHSIYAYPTQTELSLMLQRVGWRQVHYQNIWGGVCAIHWASCEFG